jgi:4-amino-4-deoxy-L-arabinose transferase and related glycosyltransferases of PMT family
VDRTPKSTPRLTAYLFFGTFFALVLFVSHLEFLQLPYFWDELGQFVPGALDILRDGAWIPHSTTPNSHPPGVMAYLALVWRVFGYSILATRVAMLALASAGVLAVFLLAIQLCQRVKGAPAYAAVLLLLASPLFYSQSMLAQLDMPVMVFTALALLFFLQGRYTASALACIGAVLMKETALATPLVLAAVLWRERRRREAAVFLVPGALLAVWLLYLAAATGHLFGSREFTQYNLAFPLHPVRLAATLLRRAWFFLVQDFHWIGTVSIVYAWRRTKLFRAREWAITGTLFGANVLVVTLLGGAALERYLLPALPLFYIAVAAAWSTLTPVWRRVSQVAMTAGLLGGLFWNPPYPFPFENNLAVVDFVRLQQAAAEFVQTHYRDETIASAWPMPDALRRPEFGYVSRPMRVKGLEDFSRTSVMGGADVLILYSRTWEPEWSLLRLAWVKAFLARYYLYQPQITPEEIYRDLGLLPVARWERRGQWIEVYAKDSGATPPVIVVGFPR